MTWGRPGDHRGPRKGGERQGERGAAVSLSAFLLALKQQQNTHTHTCPLDNTFPPHTLHIPTHRYWVIHTLTWLYSTDFLSSYLTGSRMQGSSAQHPHLPSLLLFNYTCLTFVSSRDGGAMRRRCVACSTCVLITLKWPPCNFLNNLTRAAPTETDHALCPNTEPCLPNGRESKHFISPHAILATYCWVNIITAILGALNICRLSAIIIDFFFQFCCWNDFIKQKTAQSVWKLYFFRDY